MKRSMKSMENKYLISSLELVEDVFAKSDSPEEGKTVRRLVEEIRAKKYYLPELELVMVDEKEEEVIGYAMFSRFHIEGRDESMRIYRRAADCGDCDGGAPDRGRG